MKHISAIEKMFFHKLVLRFGELVLLLSEEVYALDHVSDELVLGAADAAPVGHVEAVRDGAALPGRAARLALPLATHVIDGVKAAAAEKPGQQHVHGASQPGADVGRAAGQRAEHGVRHEGGVRARLPPDAVLDEPDPLGESGEHPRDVAARLHRDDAQVIALVQPRDERPGPVEEDAAPLGPVLVVAARGLHLVSASEQQVVINQALALLGRHARVAEHVPREVTLRVDGREHALHEVADGAPGLGAAARVQREQGEVPSDTNPSRDDLRLGALRQFRPDLGWVHIGDVFRSLHVEALVVGSYDRVEEVLEVIVTRAVAGVAADDRGRVAGAGVDGARQRPPAGARRHHVLVFLPDVACAELRRQRRVLGGARRLQLGRRVLVLGEARVHDQSEVLVNRVRLGSALDDEATGGGWSRLGPLVLLTVCTVVHVVGELTVRAARAAQWSRRSIHSSPCKAADHESEQ